MISQKRPFSLFAFPQLSRKYDKKKGRSGGQPDRWSVIIFNPLSEQSVEDEHAIGKKD